MIGVKQARSAWRGCTNDPERRQPGGDGRALSLPLPGAVHTLAKTTHGLQRILLILPNLVDIRAAAQRIGPFIHRTPVLTCTALDELTGAQLFFKCENFQKGGAFKTRGATNAVFSLTEAEASRGVATHSSGNHAAALAMAAKWRGIPAHVVMPRTAPQVKRNAAAASGANIIECEPTLEAREAVLAKVLKETGAIFVPPYNDARVIAGQGTAMLELLEQVPGLDAIVTPVGGGGLLSGTAIAAKALKPGMKVLGAEPAAADDAFRSLQAGRILPSENPQTIADGLRTSLGELTFAIIRQQADGILTIDEQGIVQAMRLLWERVKIVVEPSGSVPLAAVLAHRQSFTKLRVGIILSGGNVDLRKLPWM